MSWTDQRIARLKDLWPDNGMSADDIARILNREFPKEEAITRNAVIGKAMREHLPLRRTKGPTLNGGNGACNVLRHGAGRPPKTEKIIDLGKFPFRGPDPSSPPLTPNPAGDESGQHRGRQRTVPQPSPAEMDAAAEVGAAASRCTLMELTANTCRWPMGDPTKPDFFFCGQAPALGHPYCGFHCRKAYNPRSRRHGEEQGEVA